MLLIRGRNPKLATGPLERGSPRRGATTHVPACAKVMS